MAVSSPRCCVSTLWSVEPVLYDLPEADTRADVLLAAFRAVSGTDFSAPTAAHPRTRRVKIAHE